ncbi:hypothetical protein ATKI12_8902 [Kitasatospora sp. Ki12]
MTTDTPEPTEAGTPENWLIPTPGEHAHDLPDAKQMSTRATQTVRQNLDTVIPTCGILCIHGDVGLGKTFSVRTTLRDIAIGNQDVAEGTIHVPFGDDPSRSYFQGALHYALGLPGDPPSNRAVRERRLLETLSSRLHLLVFDEAQRLNKAALNYLWQLADARQTKKKLVIILIGAQNFYRKIQAQSPIASRTLTWQQFSRLKTEEVLAIIPDYHPLWNEASTEDITWTDTLICHGNFRNWATLTFHIREAKQKNPELKLDRTLIRWAAKKMGHKGAAL